MMSDSDERALAYLSEREYGTLAGIGWAATSDRAKPLRVTAAAEAGARLGGALAAWGWARRAPELNHGHPAYAITPQGRDELAAHRKAKVDHA